MASNWYAAPTSHYRLVQFSSHLFNWSLCVACCLQNGLNCLHEMYCLNKENYFCACTGKWILERRKKKKVQIFDQLSKQMFPSCFFLLYVCFFWIFMILGVISSNACTRQKCTTLHIKEKQILNGLYPLTWQSARIILLHRSVTKEKQFHKS